MAGSMAIQKTFPDDPTERFASPDSITRWLTAKGGKAMFPLVYEAGEIERLAGYGWTAPNPNSAIEGSKTEFAMRIGQTGTKETSWLVPYGAVIIEASRQLFDAKNFWVETRLDNTRGIGAYEALGFRVTGAEERERTVNRVRTTEPWIFMHLE
jgi:hypothetical protein